VAIPAASLEDEVFGSDDLLNKRVGNYNIVWKIGEDEWGPIYVAVQTSMARPVAMKVLSEQMQQRDPASKSRFIATARAKAAVKHPSILSVYEAGEASGQTYYTYEYVDGMHLAEAREQGRTIDDPLALTIMKVVAEGCSYLHHHKILHAPLQAQRIYLGKDNRPHLSNIAVLPGEEQPEIQPDIAELSRVITSLLPNGIASDPGLQALLTRMTTEGTGGLLSWGALQQAVKALEPKVIPADAIKLTAQEQAAIRAVEEAKKQQKRTLIMTSVGLFALLWVAGGLIYWKFFHSNERALDSMVRIPAGEFIYQDGQKATTGEFYIDKYEVTIGQYARFLEYLEANPTDEFDHPNQPKGKSHIPGANKLEWQTYYARARAGKPARFVPIDLNCPIFNVDYWDAYAYAKWANKRLPTELEWEKAARGLKGQKYPWGNEFDPKDKKLNFGEDYVLKPGPASEGKVDGYFWWNPVDAIGGDTSPFGVVGMAGNVSEWTMDASDPSGKTAVIRGGNFQRKEVGITKRITEKDGVYAETSFEFIGFRCASDKPVK
jgi:formylglycine-generating enzyme required for sulfatase activity